MANDELREYARNCGVRHYELAEALNIHETMLSKMLRYEVDADLLKKLLKLVDFIAESKKNSSGQRTQVMNPTMKKVLNNAVDEVIGSKDAGVKQNVFKEKNVTAVMGKKRNLIDAQNELLNDEWYAELFGKGSA